MRARSNWNELAKTSRTTIQFSASAHFKARATTGRIDCSRWRLTKIRDFYQFLQTPERKLRWKLKKPSLSGFGSGTLQSHFRNLDLRGFVQLVQECVHSQPWLCSLSYDISARAALTPARLCAPDALPLLTAGRSQLQSEILRAVKGARSGCQVVSSECSRAQQTALLD